MKTINLLVNFVINVPDDVDAEDCCLDFPDLEKVKILDQNLKPIDDAKVVEFETLDTDE